MSKAIVVAGASGGLGAPIARHLTAQGHDVLAVCRRQPSAGDWVRCDLTHPDGAEAVAGAVGGRALDAIVYAAGTWESGAFTDAYDFLAGAGSETERVVGVNLTAPIQLVKALAGALLRSSAPRVVFIGSLSARDNAATREVANTASKFGLRGASQALSLELPGIAFTVLNPGNVATPEVIDDIEKGRFPRQIPIPIEDLLAVLDLVLTLSPHAGIAEIDLTQRG